MSFNQPFDDLCDLIEQFPGPDHASTATLLDHLPDAETFNASEFGRILGWLAGWQGTSKIRLDECHICILSSSYQGRADLSSVVSFADRAGRGETVVNQFCKERGIGLRVLEMAPSIPHMVGNNWPEQDCMAACAFGMEATAAGGSLLGLASLAPGSDHHARIIIDKIIKQKQSIRENSSDKTRTKISLDIMRSQGGREIAASVGALVAARSRRIPVLIEGWSALAAVCILEFFGTHTVDHVKIAAVESPEQRDYARAIGMTPIIGPITNLGPGCGIALAINAISPMLAAIR